MYETILKVYVLKYEVVELQQQQIARVYVEGADVWIHGGYHECHCILK